MAEYDNKNRFALFRNKEKRNPNGPDFSGTFTDSEGREYFIDAWSQTPKNGGEKFLSGNVKLKDQRRDVPQRAAPKREMANALDDEMPF